MNVDIKFAIEHDYFMEPMEVWVKWIFPFLPRVGERVNPWIWIDGKMTKAKIKKNLTPEGENDLANWKGKISDWLYEVGISNDDKVKSISYWQKNSKKDEVYALIRIGELEQEK